MTELTIKTPTRPINILFVFLHLIIACSSPYRMTIYQYIHEKRRINGIINRAETIGENTMSFPNPNNSLNASFANHREPKDETHQIITLQKSPFRTRKSIT